MKFTIADLKLLRKMVACTDTEEETQLYGYLQDFQPDPFFLIQDVSIDPRCSEACRYCTLFCGLALDLVELRTGEIPSPFSEYEFRDLAGQVARRDKHL